MNTTGQVFRLTTFGESHGQAIGGIIDGCPAGMFLDIEAINKNLSHRRPGGTGIASSRKETDKVKILSGISEDGITLGSPIGFVIKNEDMRPSDYSELKNTFRPSHADFTYQEKYGIRDYRGGGRASARETACRIVGGAVASQIIATHGIKTYAYTSQIGNIAINGEPTISDLDKIYSNAARCPDLAKAEEMERLILGIKSEGDTIGGIVNCIITGMPTGIGSPIFGKLQAKLAHAMMTIPAAKAFEYGMGFDGCCRKGSEMADIFICENGKMHTRTNHSGGIQGGISNGETIRFRVGFKPAATLMRPIATVDANGNQVTLMPKGRHDPCVVPRAVPIVEAMASLVLADELLIQRMSRI